MTDDFRQGLQFNPYSVPRAYKFYQVNFKVRNKLTDEVIGMPFYISTKFTIKWLESIMHGSYYLPLPTENFEFSWTLREVQDNDRIVFHHIRTKEEWEHTSVKYVLTVVLSHHWRIDYIKKIKKIFKNIVTFLKYHLFIDEVKIITN